MDLISRQDAIDALHQYFACGFEEDSWWNSTHVLAALKGLPSAQRKGKWIYLTGLDAFECSVCGSSMVRNIFNYCPWCGAEMVKGESDETD